MSMRISRVSPFFETAQFANSEKFDFHVWFPPGLSDAIEPSTSGVRSLYRETKFIIGFDFDVTLSSSESFCVRTICRTEMANVNKHKRWFHSSHVKFPFVKMSASWFLVSMYLIWILGSKQIRSNNQSRATLWVLENMSHCRASSLYDHLDHCFVVFKHIQQSFLMRRLDV